MSWWFYVSLALYVLGYLAMLADHYRDWEMTDCIIMLLWPVLVAFLLLWGVIESIVAAARRRWA